MVRYDLCITVVTFGSGEEYAVTSCSHCGLRVRRVSVISHPWQVRCYELLLLSLSTFVLEEKKVCLCSRRWPEDNWCCLVAAVVVLIVVAAVGIASWHDAAAVFFGCVRQDVTHDTFIGTSWLRNYRQMWLSGYSALTLETSAPGLPGYYVIYKDVG